ncbi:MAG: hypothetical protein C0425_06710 [Chlorobiaceae bacterium]|nr:hypothetical protein [Chlorobiaceae bacterium]MBA4310012.1 hypothetical protein [Chlorobiaceae bacterium]
MEAFLNSALDDCSKFIAEAVAVFNKKKLSSGIISYSLKLEKKISDISFQTLCNKINPTFLFENQKEEYSFIALGEVHTIIENGLGRFAQISKRKRMLIDKVQSNWNKYPGMKFPLFVGGLKFSVEHDEEEWKNFQDSIWYIPELLLYNNNQNTYLIFNSTFENKISIRERISVFKKYFELISDDSSFEKINNKKIELLSITGNSAKDKKKWMQNVNEILDRISSNEVEKVVIARRNEILFSEPPSIDQLINKLREKNKSSLLFAFSNHKSIFFGASPERLFTIHKGKLTTDALAGSIKKDDDTPEELLFSEKNRLEHKFVVDFLVKAFCEFSEEIKYEIEPEVKNLNNIKHLWTKIVVELKADVSIFNMMEKVFPSPAICGFPKAESFRLIKKIEENNRGLYSGVIGWFNLNWTCEFAVAIRSALLNEKKLFVYAGAGIVADSDPEEEFFETELKMKTIQSLFIDEN